MDPRVFRYYECNLEAPYVKADKKLIGDVEGGAITASSVTTDSLDVKELHLSGSILMYSGEFPPSTTHILTSTEIPPLGNKTSAGELTFILDSQNYINISMGAYAMTEGQVLTSVVYQRIGNFESVNLTGSGRTLALTISPSARCRWIFRGI